MKKLIYFLMVSLFFSCEKKDQETYNALASRTTYAMPNLISNSGFESGGLPSLNGWNYISGPCCLDTFSTDVPAGGGTYSLKLEPMWLPAEGTVETYITGLNCTRVFQLKFDAKCINVVTQQPYAAIYLKNGPFPAMSVVQISNPSWTLYTLSSMNYTMTPSDTLVVRLSAGSTEVANWQVLFDKVKLY